MQKTKVYDLPTRIFHWLFVGLFLGAFFIAKVIDDDSPNYSYHMLLGIVLALVVCLRVIWGFLGSKYARFSTFALKPNDLFQYFKQLLTGKTIRTLGHNAASSWAALVMMAMALGLAVTGYLMATGGNKEVIEDVHELFANIFVVTAIMHVLGVVVHSIRHRDWIALSMVNGKKMAVGGGEAIQSSHRGAGIVFVALVGAFTLYLSQHYDSSKQSLQFFGSTLQLGEGESGHEEDSD